jgi:hypothetical protein
MKFFSFSDYNLLKTLTVLILYFAPAQIALLSCLTFARPISVSPISQSKFSRNNSLRMAMLSIGVMVLYLLNIAVFLWNGNLQKTWFL